MGVHVCFSPTSSVSEQADSKHWISARGSVQERGLYCLGEQQAQAVKAMLDTKVMQVPSGPTLSRARVELDVLLMHLRQDFFKSLEQLFYFSEL